jgi:MinD-like ATPase involved in chromosome partitioning or flagellar assembly
VSSGGRRGPVDHVLITGGCDNTLAENRADQAAGAEPARLAGEPDGRPADGGAGPGEEKTARWADGGIGGLFGSVPAQAAAPAGKPAPGRPPAGRPAAGDAPEQPADHAALADTDPDALRGDDALTDGRRRRRPGGAGPGAADATAAGRGTHARNAAREAQRAAAGRPRTVTITAEPDGPAPLLLPPRRRAPAPGWRRTVYRASGGFLRVPVSAAEAARRDMIGRARTPVAAGHHRVAILSMKGGVGKTTTAVGLGSTLASVRGDRVIALDANSDRGTLSDKITTQTAATIRDLLNDKEQIRRYADVRGFTSQAPSRLEVLASAQDPNVRVPFSESDYTDVCALLERYYSVCVTDCGTGLMHSAMAGVLRMADQMVLATTASVDGARSASACMDWLTAHGHHDLVRNGVVVITAVRRHGRLAVDRDMLDEHFAARCRAVLWVPYDQYLAQGAEMELDQLRKSTADAFLELAAVVGDGFCWRRERKALTSPAG